MQIRRKNKRIGTCILKSIRYPAAFSFNRFKHKHIKTHCVSYQFNAFDSPYIKPHFRINLKCGFLFYLIYRYNYISLLPNLLFTYTLLKAENSPKIIISTINKYTEPSFIKTAPENRFQRLNFAQNSI